MSQLTLELIAERNRDKANAPTEFETEGQSMLPCPFCGSADLTVRGDDDVEFCFWVHCMHCNAEGPIAQSRRFAIVKWQKQPDCS